MDLRSLRYFMQIAGSGSLTRAATRLRVAQPSLTQYMHKLEQELGTPLFLRANKGVTLTEAGVLLREHAERILRDIDHVRGAIRAAGIAVAPERRGIGMVFQSYAIWPHMSVAGNFLAYPNALSGQMRSVHDGVAETALPGGTSFRALWRGSTVQAGQTVTIAFRADRVAFTANRPEGPGNVMPASVAAASVLGTVMDYTLFAGGTKLKAEGPPTSSCRPTRKGSSPLPSSTATLSDADRPSAPMPSWRYRLAGRCLSAETLPL